MEIMTGAENPEEEKACFQFLSTFTVHQLTAEIAAEAVRIRKKFHLRLPDAVVWGTARVQGCLLVTRNTKDFSIREPGVRVPYSLS